MGIKRRIFLIGGAALIGGGIFGVGWADHSARSGAIALTRREGEGSFLGWIKIAADDVVTLYSPHIDFGQGSHTALAQMLAEELDADIRHIRVEQAPPDPGFANTALVTDFMGQMTGQAGLVHALPVALMSMVARSMAIQITGGSSAIRSSGQAGFRTLGAAARGALLAEAAERLSVPASELTAADSVITHARTGRTLRFGELAEAASSRSLNTDIPLKTRAQYKHIGHSTPRFDIPAKVDGSAVYGIDFTVPNMRVATLAMAPVRGGKLTSVDPALALAVPGVQRVVQLETAVVVIADSYWRAQKGLMALAPVFDNGDHGALSSQSIFATQTAANATGATLTAPAGGRIFTAEYQTPFLHQAMMEPFAMTGHYHGGKLEVWGGTQDPLSARGIMAESAGVDFDDVVFHPMIMGGGFGRRFPGYSEILDQIARVARQVDYPVKLIWSRETDVAQGAYRPAVSARAQAVLGTGGRITQWVKDYAQPSDAAAEAGIPYAIPGFEARHHEITNNQTTGFWRSVDASQHGFFNESFVDELAHAAGDDPYQFRRKHLPTGSRQLAVLDAVAQRAGWGSPLPAGTGRGIALVESFNSIVGEVIEATTAEDGSVRVLKAWAVVDCGTTVNPRNAEAQIEGGLIMGLSAAIGEQITLSNGEVQQRNFSDYPVMKLADAPPVIDVHFIESGATMGGIGEPGLPPAAPALTNALFAATGKRIRQLPILLQARA